MRRDGDLLLEHLGVARKQVLLCAPFIKAKVFKKLLSCIAPSVSVRVVTRWLPEEVAAGVSDLEVFDLVTARPGASLALLDRLHAKLYLADDAVLIGSANLTATALGWCNRPNLEILTSLPISDESVARCLRELDAGRQATEAERQRVRDAADKLAPVQLPVGQEADDASTGIWLPRLGGPARLYAAYLPNSRDRLSASVLEAADHDLQALDLPPGLNQESFMQRASEAFAEMPAIARILTAAASDLTDGEAVALIAEFGGEAGIPSDAQWRVVRDWMVHFLSDRYEIAPQSFITRRRATTRG